MSQSGLEKKIDERNLPIYTDNGVEVYFTDDSKGKYISVKYNGKTVRSNKIRGIGDYSIDEENGIISIVTEELDGKKKIMRVYNGEIVSTDEIDDVLFYGANKVSIYGVVKKDGKLSNLLYDTNMNKAVYLKLNEVKH